MIKDFGHFTRYTPTPDHPYYIPGGGYFRNEEGTDYLVGIVMTQASYEDGELVGAAQLPYYASIFQGRVFYVTSDPMRIVPADMTVIGSDEPIPLGYAWDGTALSEPPLPVPNEISDRQFFQQMAISGLITEAEALAAVQTGTLPAALETFIGNLPEGERFSARMVISGASSFHRDHPLVAAFGTMQGMTSAQVDDLWRAAAAL